MFQEYKSQSQTASSALPRRAWLVVASPNRLRASTRWARPGGPKPFEWHLKSHEYRAMIFHLCRPGTRVGWKWKINWNLLWCKSSALTWVTIETIAQQKPPMKAVMNIVSTDLANTVKIHDNENGKDIKARTRLRPYCMANPPNIPPKRAPSRERLATQLASWSVTEKLVKFVCWLRMWSSWRLAMAGLE